MDLQEAIRDANREWQENPQKEKDEVEVISRYGAIFSPSNINNITKDDFLSFLKYENNKHWGGIWLHGLDLADDIEKFRKTLKILLDENISIEQRIKRIRDPASPDYHKRFGPAYYTPILLMAYPKKYPVINGIVKDALEKSRVYTDFDSKNEWTAYAECVDKISDIAQKNNVSLWKMDWVWWYISSINSFDDLYKFISKKMDPKKNYQPVMLLTLLKLGTASKQIIDDEIRKYNPDKEKDFVSREVYETLVDKPKIVKKIGNDFTLNLTQELTKDQNEKLRWYANIQRKIMMYVMVKSTA